MGNGSVVFQNAIAKFKRRLTKKELADFQTTDAQDFKNAIAAIQVQQESHKELMNLTRIARFLEGMEQLSKVIEVFLNVNEAVAFIWGPLKFILQTASTWATAFDALLDAYQRIGEHLPLLQQFDDLFRKEPHMERVLELIYIDILEFHQHALRFFSDKIWKQVFNSMWKDFETRYRGTLNRLRDHGDLIASQAALLHYEQSRDATERLLEKLKDMDTKIRDSHDLLERTEREEQHKRRIAIKEWLASTSPRPFHDDACRTREENSGSGEWILTLDGISDWIKSEFPRYPTTWMNGIPGAGKTVLASRIIQFCHMEPMTVTSYFYCRHNNPEANTCSAVLRSFVSQLLDQHQDLLPHFYDHCHRSTDLVLSSESMMKEFVELFVLRGPRHYFVVDGLDECAVPERRSLLSFFNSMVDKRESKDPGKLRILVVSQDENDIRKAMSNAEVVNLVEADNRQDIICFAEIWAKKIREKHDLSIEQADSIARLTCHEARGMFLYAELVLKNLFDQPKRQMLMKEIEHSTFPKGIQEAYKRIMDRIQRDHVTEWEILKQLLGWMICARRPLRWREIQGALSINVELETINFDESLQVHIRDFSGSLVKLLGEDQLTLVHSTANKYIVDIGYVRPAVVECHLTTLTLQYLTFQCFDTPLSEGDLLCFINNGYYVFQDYAIAKWAEHFTAVVNSSKDLTILDDDTKTALESLGEALDMFMDRFGRDIGECNKNFVTSSSLQIIPVDTVILLESFVNTNHLQVMWRHIMQVRQQISDVQNQITLPSLDRAWKRVCTRMEKLCTYKEWTGDQRKKLDMMYGSKYYKCPKLRCYNFHEGFQNIKARDAHVNRHERPFLCTFADCSSSEFGFASKKDLEGHMNLTHPEAVDRTKIFHTTPAPLIKSKWRCEICDKSFARHAILKSHKMVHDGLKPFTCQHCGKGFSWKSDMTRHEKIHERRNRR